MFLFILSSLWYCSICSSVTETTHSSTAQPVLRYPIDDRTLVLANHLTLLVEYRFGVHVEPLEDPLSPQSRSPCIMSCAKSSGIESIAETSMNGNFLCWSLPDSAHHFLNRSFSQQYAVNLTATSISDERVTVPESCDPNTTAKTTSGSV